MVTEYRAGSISDIIAKSAGSKSAKLELDPKLASIFGGAGKEQKQTTWRKVPVKQATPAFAMAIPKAEASVQRTDGRRNKVKDGEVLSHSDAAAIRVQAKAKYRHVNSADGPEVHLPAIKRKFKREKSDDESSAEEEDVIPAKKLKKKKKKIVQKPADSSDEEEANLKNENAEDLSEEDKYDSDSKQKVKKLKVKQEVNPEEEEEAKPKTLAELNAPKEKNAELESRTVFVGNVPKDTTKKAIRRLFKPFGEIETIRFRGATPAKPTQLKKVALRKNELHPDRSSITAFVRFKTRAEAEEAARGMSGKEIDEHHLNVDLADNSNAKKNNKLAVFLGNLHMKTEDDELWNFFKECGYIRNVRVVRDGATGLGKGFGYINFETEDSVQLALKLNGKLLRGRDLRISKAVRKPKLKANGQKKSQGERQRGGKPNPNFSENGHERSHEDYRRPPRPKFKTNHFEKKREAYSGDQLSEIGKLKRNSHKVNKDEQKKARIAKQLVGDSFSVKKPVQNYPPRAHQKQMAKKKKMGGKGKPQPKDNKKGKGGSGGGGANTKTLRYFH